MCNRFGGDMPNENLHRVTQMQNYIAMAFTNLHTGLDRVQKMLMNGNPLSNHSQLAQWMDRPEIADAVTRLVKHEDEYRRSVNLCPPEDDLLTDATKKHN
jgi:hypothetical protein